MESTAENFDRKRWGRTIGNGVIAATVLVLVLVILETDRNPRTDDASVRTNFIEIAPEVSGRLVDLPAKDNAL
jgi:multidrug efflux system membrane fusion protein